MDSSVVIWQKVGIISTIFVPMGITTKFSFLEVEPGDHKLLLKDRLFLSWEKKIHQNFRLEEIDFQSADFVRRNGNRQLLFLKLKALAFDCDDNRVPGVVFLRGGAVGILVLLRSDTQHKVLVVHQARMGTAEPDCPEIPAGMLDGESDFVAVAVKELEEETGLKVQKHELFDLHRHFFGEKHPGFHSSIGVSDEFVRLLLFEKTVSTQELIDFGGRHFSNPHENEYIRTSLVDLDAAEAMFSDAKSLFAVSLYRRLLSERKL